MLRKLFDQEIRNTKDEIVILGSMVEQAVLAAAAALKQHNLRAAQQIVENDALVNAKCFDIKNQVINLIAMQQPMAHDLRVIASILEIIGELERIGDYAKGIGQMCIRIGERPAIGRLSDLPLMAQLAMSMLHRSLVAFADEDAVTARTIPDEDDNVDNLYLQFYRVMISYVLENESNIEEVICLLRAAHYLERAADRVSNICERTVFIVTGEITELTGHRTEQTSV